MEHTQQASRPTRRACFIRRKLGEFRAQADFNRGHYSEAEAFCWDAAAADCLQALGGIAGNWQRATDEHKGAEHG